MLVLQVEILDLAGHRLNTGGNTQATGDSDEEDVTRAIVCHTCLPDAHRHDGDPLRVEGIVDGDVVLDPFHENKRISDRFLGDGRVEVLLEELLIRREELVTDTRVHHEVGLDLFQILIAFRVDDRTVLQVIVEDRGGRIAQVLGRNGAQESHCRWIPLILTKEALDLLPVAAATDQVSLRQLGIGTQFLR